jgi:hypothetical protein
MVTRKAASKTAPSRKAKAAPARKPASRATGRAVGKTAAKAPGKTARNAATKTPANTSGKSARKTSNNTPVKTTPPQATPATPVNYRARVRMYRHGLGDCFLLTFPRSAGKPFQVLIDCGALARDQTAMQALVTEIRDTVRGGPQGKARLDVVVGTHEHKDHLSGFNQARDIFESDFEFGSVWLAWTENLGKSEIKKIKDTKRKAVARLAALVDSASGAAKARFAGSDTVGLVQSLIGFSHEPLAAAPTVAEAFEYLKARGKKAGDLRYLEPGSDAFDLEGVDGVRVYVLGPPKDPVLLKTSAVTEAMKSKDVIYHLAGTGDVGMDALSAAVEAGTDMRADRYHPFSAEHRITLQVQDPVSKAMRPHPYHQAMKAFLAQNYDDPAQAWRRIDTDWLAAFGQLALDLDSDTNNTSLVLAFEFKATREVLLFVADAQIGSWLSWVDLEFKVAGQDRKVPALDLLSRTVFYKVGHHCSHNATAKVNGLELMTRDDLVAFIPLDKETAAKQGSKGWEMPAPPLFKALKERTGQRLVMSDVKETLSPEAAKAGVVATKTYVDFFLK